MRGYLIEDLITWTYNQQEEILTSRILAINSTENVTETSQQYFKGPYDANGYIGLAPYLQSVATIKDSSFMYASLK